MANTYELIVKTVDQSSRTLKNVDTALQRVGRTAKTVGAALAGLAAGSVARGIINQYTQFERYRTVLSTFLGSQQAANRELQRLQVLANSLPQDLQDITEAFVILNRFGIDTSSEALTAFSNIATANSRSFTQLGEAVADALTGEFERLKEFGIRVARENGQFVATIGEDQVALASTTEDLVRQLQALGEEGGRFSGAAEANASTLGQAFSNLQGAIFETSVAIGEELKPALIEVTNLTTQLLRDNQELARAIGAGTGEAIRTLASAVQLLAANFDLITDVALTLIFVRIASSVATLVGSLARATVNTKNLITTAGGIRKVFATATTGAGNLIGRLTGLSGVITTLGKLTPIGRVITIGITAAIAAITFLRDKTFQVGETTTTVSEIARVVFFKIGQVATTAANVLGSAWQNAVTQVRGFFTDGFGANIISVLQSVGSAALTVANAIIGYFIFTYRSIVGIFQNLPAAFVETFKAIGATAQDFGTRIVTQFTSIGNALLLAIQAPFSKDIAFQDAFDALTQNAFEGLGDSIKENFSPVTEGIRAALEEAGEALSGNYIEDTFAGYVAAIEATILEFREYQAQLESTAAATEVYDDAIMRVARGLGVLGSSATEAETALSPLEKRFNEVVAAATEASNGQELNRQVLALLIQAYRDGTITLQVYNQALAQIGATATQTGQQLSAYQQFLNSTVESATRSAQEIGFASQAQADLRQQLADGKISIDTYAQAMERLNGILGINTSATSGTKEAIATVASTYRDAIDAIKEFELNQTNITGAMQLLERDFANGVITLDQFGIAMQGMGANMDDIQNRSIALGLTLTESFEKAGDGLARGLARGIARGEGIMQSFKNFMQSILEEILYQIIQQAFIKPLISSMTQGLSSAFGAFSAGGASAFGGGLFGGGGGFLGGLFGIGRLFLGFADGGVVPGQVTKGDSVPALLTPGEVILNKRQQADFASMGNSEPITVNFNINAIDTRSGTEFILQNKKQITSVIQQAYNTRGQQGPLG